MALPEPVNTHYYQGIIIAEVALTLLLFVIFQILYYIKWGYGQQVAEKQEKKQGQEESKLDRFKWDQKTWNIYFPIIFANHLVALALPLIYAPFVFTIVIAFIHFGCFVALLIVNIVLKDSEQSNGQGAKTWACRGIWIGMCVLNIILIITGLANIATVLVAQ